MVLRRIHQLSGVNDTVESDHISVENTIQFSFDSAVSMTLQSSDSAMSATPLSQDSDKKLCQNFPILFCHQNCPFLYPCICPPSTDPSIYPSIHMFPSDQPTIPDDQKMIGRLLTDNLIFSTANILRTK